MSNSLTAPVPNNKDHLDTGQAYCLNSLRERKLRRPMHRLFTFSTILFTIFGFAYAENVYCTYYRETDEITCGHVTCPTHNPSNFTEWENEGLDMKLPKGWYRIGVMQIRRDTAWFNLYRRRAIGNGYWDFYTNIPERNCVGGFGLHSGENIAGSVTVRDKKCFDRLVYQIERKSTSEKFDVYQCRQCVFHSCWLGWRVLPAAREYLTNLRSY